MFFRQIFRAPFLFHLHNLDENVLKKFVFDSPAGRLAILLRHPTTDEQARNQWRANEVLCETLAEREPSKKIRDVFEMVSRRELPDAVDRSEMFPGSVDDEGKIQLIGMLRLEQFSGGFAIYCREIFRELATKTSQVISTLRWRMGLEQGPQPVAKTWNEMFSFDGLTWFHLPSDIHSTVHAIQPKIITEDLLAEVARIVEAEQEEPLPHMLFREAWSLRMMNARSSLLIGVAAAEVAVKSYIAVIVPEARWLVENLASPPIEKMLKEYLPTLSRRASGADVDGIPSAIIAELKTAVMLRNKLSHAGEFTLDYVSLEKKLLAIKDLIWLLDYLAGREWALEYVRAESLLSGL